MSVPIPNKVSRSRSVDSSVYYEENPSLFPSPSPPSSSSSRFSSSIPIPIRRNSTSTASPHSPSHFPFSPSPSSRSFSSDSYNDYASEGIASPPPVPPNSFVSPSWTSIYMDKISPLRGLEQLAKNPLHAEITLSTSPPAPQELQFGAAQNGTSSALRRSDPMQSSILSGRFSDF